MATNKRALRLVKAIDFINNVFRQSLQRKYFFVLYKDVYYYMGDGPPSKIVELHELFRISLPSAGPGLLRSIWFFLQKTNPVKLEASSNGTLRASFVVDKTKCNFGGILHGGYIAAMVDVMSYYFTAMMAPNGRASYTTNMNVNYVKAVQIGEKVIVETKTLKSGKFALIETYFHSENGHFLAKGTASFLAAEDEFQKITKDTVDFDVYEN